MILLLVPDFSYFKLMNEDENQDEDDEDEQNGEEKRQKQKDALASNL